MKCRTLAAAAALALAAAAPGHASSELPQETVDKIMAMLAEMQCEMDPDDIEVEADGIELDDVFCADGQYDIALDNDLNVTGKRKE